eukprot:13750682-Alexandrium_andersonii.AAC.1
MKGKRGVKRPADQLAIESAPERKAGKRKRAAGRACGSSGVVDQDGEDLREMGKKLKKIHSATTAEDNTETEGMELSKREQKFLDELRNAISEGDVTSRSSIGQRFARSLTDAQKKAYQKLTDDKARKTFRMQWAQRDGRESR